MPKESLMRIALAVCCAGILIGCAATETDKSIDVRLGRIEARLDDLAARLGPQPPSASETVPEEVVRLRAKIRELENQGFTDNWPALGQMRQELARRIADSEPKAAGGAKPD